MANVGPPPNPSWKQVLEVGLVPQDNEAVARAARIREYDRMEQRRIEFLRARRRKRAARVAREALEQDLYVEAALLLATAKVCLKGFGNPYGSIQSIVAALKSGVFGSPSGAMKGVKWS